METFLSIKIEPEKLFGHLVKAMIKGETLVVSASINTNEKEGSPKFSNNMVGVAVWEKESKFTK